MIVGGLAETRQLILQLALDLIKQNKALRVLIKELGINEYEVHGRIDKILSKRPTIAIPIDAVPKDLKEWAQTLRNTVKIWVIEKYALAADLNAVLYSIPDENLPTLTTGPGKGDAGPPIITPSGSQLFGELLDAFPYLEGQQVFLKYGPLGKPKQTFEGTIRKEGIEVDGKVYSPSYAAVACMKKAGSSRKTANGWLMCKTEQGKLLNDLYQEISSETQGSGKVQSSLRVFEPQ